MRTERELLVDCLQRLNRLAFPYMLTGSTASNYWGRPRTTDDLDFVLMIKPVDVPAFVAEFDAGFFLQQESVRRAFSSPYQFNAIDELSNLKVDFWMLREDEFELNMFSRRLSITYHDTPAWIATAEDLILHKLYWHRITPSDRQLRDAAGIFSVQADSLDREYMCRWASKLAVAQELDEIFAGRIKPKST
jgi:hypothetical protein